MENKKLEKRLWLAVLIVAIIIMALVLLYFAGFIFKTDETAGEYTVTSGQTTSEALPQNPIDFNSLRSQNEEIIGWLRIKSCDIDRPILRPWKNDDSYYLDHDFKGNYTTAGAIYMEKQNSKTFGDRMTLLYGHNWVTNGFFRPLYNFKDKDFFDKNDTFFIYTPGHILTYEIVAAYTYDNRHILNSFDFSKQEVFEDYLKELQTEKIGKNLRDVALSADSKIVTMSTCVVGEPDKRYLVAAVQISDEITR